MEPRQIGEDSQTKVLRIISKQLDQLIKLTGKLASVITTTTTTTSIP